MKPGVLHEERPPAGGDSEDGADKKPGPKVEKVTRNNIYIYYKVGKKENLNF